MINYVPIELLSHFVVSVVVLFSSRLDDEVSVGIPWTAHSSTPK